MISFCGAGFVFDEAFDRDRLPRQRRDEETSGDIGSSLLRQSIETADTGGSRYEFNCSRSRSRGFPLP